MLSLCHWHEYLDILFLFKADRGLIVTDADILPKQVDKANLAMKLRKFLYKNSLLFDYYF